MGKFLIWMSSYLVVNSVQQPWNGDKDRRPVEKIKNVYWFLSLRKVSPIWTSHLKAFKSSVILRTFPVKKPILAPDENIMSWKEKIEITLYTTIISYTTITSRIPQLFPKGKLKGNHYSRPKGSNYLEQSSLTWQARSYMWANGK